MRRPASVIAAQVFIGFFFLLFVFVFVYIVVSLRARSAHVPLLVLACVLLVAAAVPTVLGFTLVALWRRFRNAQFLAALIIVLFVILSSVSAPSRALWTAFIGGAQSTHMQGPYFNYANRTEVIAGVGAALVGTGALLALAAILVLSGRVRAFLAGRTPPV